MIGAPRTKADQTEPDSGALPDPVVRHPMRLLPYCDARSPNSPPRRVALHPALLRPTSVLPHAMRPDSPLPHCGCLRLGRRYSRRGSALAIIYPKAHRTGCRAVGVAWAQGKEWTSQAPVLASSTVVGSSYL